MYNIPRNLLQAVLFLTLAVTLSLMLDLSNSFWITRSRMGRNRFGRFGRSDPDMVDGKYLTML